MQAHALSLLAKENSDQLTSNDKHIMAKYSELTQAINKFDDDSVYRAAMQGNGELLNNEQNVSIPIASVYNKLTNIREKQNYKCILIFDSFFNSPQFADDSQNKTWKDETGNARFKNGVNMLEEVIYNMLLDEQQASHFVNFIWQLTNIVKPTQTSAFRVFIRLVSS